MLTCKVVQGIRIDPYPHGLDWLADQEGPDNEEAVKNADRTRRLRLATRLVARYLRNMAGDPMWSRSTKKKATALALAAIVADPSELLLFINANFSEPDGQLVYLWVADYLFRHYRVDVSNVTVATVVEELEAAIEKKIQERTERHASRQRI